MQPTTMRRAFALTFVAAAVVGIYLIARGGGWIAAIGASGIACGILYTGGPRPLGYLGLGDVLVLVYFGPIAVAGSHYVQGLQWSGSAFVAGLAPGFLSTALLAVNNLRDIDTDRRAGKRTLAVRFGRRFAVAEYCLAIAVAAAVPACLWITGHGPVWCLLASASCALAWPAIAQVRAATPGAPLLPALAATGRLLTVYGLTFALTWPL